MDNQLITKISRKFGQPISKGSIIASESFLSGLLTIMRPRTVLEIGTLRGCSAALFSQYAEKVITLDLASAPNDNHKLAKEVWFYLGVTHQIQDILVNNNEEKREIILNQKFDAAFVDGGHKYCDVEFDFSCVRNCGIVLFHDYKPTTSDYNDCDNKRYEGIVQFVDGLTPPAFIWGPHCKQFALWVERTHPLRLNKLFKNWSVTSAIEFQASKETKPDR